MSETEKKNNSTGDLAEMANINGNLQDSYIDFQVKKPLSFVRLKKSDYGKNSIVYLRKRTDLPVLLMFRDSFASSVLNYLPESFSRSIAIWKNQVDFSIVLKAKPDIVILELNERYSSVLCMPNCSAN